MKWMTKGLLIALALMCMMRAGVEVRRIITEQPAQFHPEISACSNKPLTQEELIVWNFRNLGAACEK